MENQIKKNKWTDFFNFNRDNRPDAKEEDTTPNVKFYFKSLLRKFWKLSALTLMMMVGAIPLFVAFFLSLNIPTTPAGNDVIFPQLYGANLIDASPITTFFLDLFGAQSAVHIYSAMGYYIGIAACILVFAITFGWQNVGVTYVLRGMVRGEPVFLISDYFYGIKKNLKQGFFLGLIDALVLFFLGYDFLFFLNRTGTFFMDVGFYAVLAMAVLYFFMRFYLYLLQITFHLSIRKILKNALIFAILGFKRNFMGALGMVLLTAILALFLPLMAFNIVLVLILPILFYFACTAFTAAYAAYPIIDRYMIAPYVNAEDDGTDAEAEAETEDSEEPSADN